MSLTSAKDLLAQADRLMRQRSPEELPVLTDLVIEDDRAPGLEFHPDVGHRADVRLHGGQSSPIATTPTPSAAVPVWAPHVAMPSAPLPPQEVPGVRPTVRAELPVTSILASPVTANAVASVREQFNAQLAAKLEELQHSVFSQVMQQLELYADGPLRKRLRDAVEPALVEIARDMAAQVADDTAMQVREVVSKSVEAEIVRLREQLSRRRT